MDPSRRFLVSVVLMVFCICSGTLGYMIIEGASFADAAYMTVITISTVGYQETVDLSPAGRVFTIAVILFGVGSMYYASVSLVTFFVGGELHAMREKVKVQKRINQLDRHIVICGYGRMGRTIVSQLVTQDHRDVVIIDNHADKIAELESDGLLFVKGDAEEEDTVLQAGVGRARTLVATLPRDSDNVFVTLTARGINPDMFIIARAEAASSEGKLIRAGANRVVCPQEIGAHRVSNLIIRPKVVDFVDVAARGVEFEITEFEVTEDSSLAGASLRDSGLRQKVDAMVIAIRRPAGEAIFNPTAEMMVQAGDTLIMIGRLNTSVRLAEL